MKENFRHSPETIKKKSGENHPFYGKKLSEEEKQRISKSLTGKKQSTETRKKKSDAHKGKQKSDKHKDNIRKALSGQKHTTTVCPYCNKVGGSRNMKRYHFDNCKEKIC